MPGSVTNQLETLKGTDMAAATSTGPILITGCSSGIGHSAAMALHRAGRTVYATARRPDSIADLAELGIRTLALDVTDEASMQTAVGTIESGAGPIGVLINNAGYGLYGPVEQVSMDEVRRQFETNFFGLVRLTQLVLPGMRTAGRGRILNVSSMGGRVTLPGGAFYHASKYAVEGLSDALRMELAQFGIDVVLIEPGPVRTPWNDIAVGSLADSSGAGAGGAGSAGAGADGAGADGASADGPGSGRAGADGARAGQQREGAVDPYGPYKKAVADAFATAQSGPIGRLGSTADDIAKVIVTAVTAKRPRTRYLINAVAKTMVATRALLPDRLSDRVIGLQYGLPR